MNISKATESYEKWVSQQTQLVAKDVAFKHEQMAAGIFEFFRATFYRWAQLWKHHAGDAADAPEVLAVGDLHLENFGTWRDAEGRLVWGVNDFDEVHELPYTFDLIRLATSTLLVRRTERLAIGQREGCEALLDGYTDAMAAGGRAFVLGERHEWLSALAHNELRNPVMFWARLRESPAPTDPISPEAVAALELLMPDPIPRYEIVQRTKGLGSLGHLRFIALAKHGGGMIAREAKALSASACVWAWDEKMPKKLGYSTILEQSVRCQDPLVKVEGTWLSRRLAPDCSRIELSSLARVADEARLLRAMGWETANIHLGTDGAAKRISRDLRKRARDWLLTGSKKLANEVTTDFEEWSEQVQKNS